MHVRQYFKFCRVINEITVTIHYPMTAARMNKQKEDLK